MKFGLGEVLNPEKTMIKTAFLSYYISMYNTVSRDVGFDQFPVTVDEIYDFIQDLKHEGGKHVPNISRDDISLCFQVLQMTGICK